jgi:hypothetical protein
VKSNTDNRISKAIRELGMTVTIPFHNMGTRIQSHVELFTEVIPWPNVASYP